MAKMIKIHGGTLEETDFDEGSDSDEEYTEREKKLLKKYRESRKSKEDKKKAVLAFDEEEESDFEYEDNENDVADSDIEGKEEEDGDIPDARAWGKKRSMYYNTDFIDPDYSGYTDKERELAQQEEEEAKSIQQRLAAQLADADFSLDLFNEAQDAAEKVKEDEDHIKLKGDFRSLTSREKQRLFEKESPEFKNLIKDFEDYFKESKTLLQPFLNYVLAKSIDHEGIKFAKLRNNLIMNYCINIGFYLTLKAKRIQIKNHPVVKRLAQIKKLLNQLEEKYANIIKPEVEKAVEAIKSGKQIEITKETEKESKKLKKKNQLNVMKAITETKSSNGVREAEDLAANGVAMETDDSEEDEQQQENDEEMADGDDRRAITYEIAKNKGLTPHRKKELRNPRVKHRNKYRKAIIRRKGAVRTVRKEIRRYDGEISGIKASVRKGIKFKS